MLATNITVCTDISESVEFLKSHGLYLKPIAKLNISVGLPQLKNPGGTISNWEVMEKLKSVIQPATFLTLRIIKSTVEFLRFEGELESNVILSSSLSLLDGKLIKLSGFSDKLKIRAARAKISFPTIHDWESFFRDAKNMNEMKAGERPDTIQLKDLPSRWFSSRKDEDRDKPSETILKKVFDSFGEVRCVDIPMLDPYRKEMTAAKKLGSMNTFTHTQDMIFDAYVQYKDYVGFDQAMASLRGMKLLYREGDKMWTANIKVDFDRTKHLTDRAIRKRHVERNKLQELERYREEKVRREREIEERKREEERRRIEEEEEDRERKRKDKIKRRVDRRHDREDKRRQKRVEEKQRIEEEEMQKKIALEERKLLIAQRKLESIRLLSELFNRVKEIKIKEDLVRKEKEAEMQRKREVENERKRQLAAEKKREENAEKKKIKLAQQEHELRNKILKKWKVAEEKKHEEQREELRRKLAGSRKLKSAIVMKR